VVTPASPARRAGPVWRIAPLLAALLLAMCAHWTPTPPLGRAGSPGYRLVSSSREKQSDELLVVLTISGGGMRAAALGYGVLEALRRTELTVNGESRTLLDEVDVISAVSGGTLPAVYYGLRGEKTFDEFGDRVLSRNLELALAGRVANPANWLRLASGTFGKSDLLAEIYDETVFGGATFADLQRAGGPFVVVNGTDVTTGARFSFTQEQLDAICGDLATVKLGRAVAASTALPPLLTPITLENRAGTCGWDGPPWDAAARAAAEGKATPGRALQRARALLAYQDPARPYVHVFDGGLSENLGLSEVIVALDILQVDPDSPLLPALRRARRVAVIAVDALRFPEVDWDRSPSPPGSGTLEGQMWSIPVDRISLDALEDVRHQLERWQAAGPAAGPARREVYLAHLTFDDLEDPAARAYFRGVKTGLALPAEQVERLREAGGELLRADPAVKRLLEDLRAGR
jgi:NTE family protein